MPQVDINYLAVLVGAVIYMAIGFVWYMPNVFGGMWMKDLNKKEMGKAGIGMLWTFIAALVTFYVLAHIVAYAGATTFGDGMLTGFWAWLGFVAAIGVSRVVFHGDSWRVWWIDNGYQLVSLVIVGGILAVWH